MNWLEKLMAFLASLFEWSTTPEPVVQPPPNPPSPPKPKDYLTLWSEAIKEFEGWTPGSTSYKHNNPGNCRGPNGDFFAFETEAAGMAYLRDYLLRACTGRHKAYKPTMTLNQMMHIYTTDPEPSPTNYALFIARKLGPPISPSTVISTLLS